MDPGHYDEVERDLEDLGAAAAPITALPRATRQPLAFCVKAMTKKRTPVPINVTGVMGLPGWVCSRPSW